MPTIDKTVIINQALTKIGVGPIFSTSAESELAENINMVWQPAVDEAFSKDDWWWTHQTRKLARQAATPQNGWAHGFDLPPDRVGAPVAYYNQVGVRPVLERHFRLENKAVFANRTDLWAKIRVPVAIDDWEVDFRAAFIVLLSAELAIPVWQDRNMRDDLRVECFGTPSEKGSGGLFGRLMAQNKAAQAIGEEAISTSDPLDDARWGSMNRDAGWAGRFA